MMSTTEDIAQDNTYIYVLVQASGSLQFCDSEVSTRILFVLRTSTYFGLQMQCTSTDLPDGGVKELIKIDKTDGIISFVTLQYNVSNYAYDAINIAARSTNGIFINFSSILFVMGHS